jgi:hypothetical protein
VNLVLGTLELTTIGGVGTYLVTIGEQLERMGHGVTILAGETGEMAAIASERGLRVVDDEGELPETCDAVYAQDAPSAYALASCYPGVPQAFCVHAPDHDRWLVPQIPGVTSAVVALHERAARYARSLGHVPEVIRLTQPVDTRRFAPRGSIGRSPRTALVLGNYSSGNRLELIRGACADAGIELVQRGLQGGGFTTSPESEMNDADLVMGKSRVVVEAMSCGRAAYVYDHDGGDGWVTHDGYERMEADNFNGQASTRPVDAGRLREDLRGYRAEMGAVNRDLAVAHHGARSHAEALVELLGRLAPRDEPAGAPLDELGRLTRVQWQADARALGFEHEARLLRAELGRRNSDQESLLRETELAQQRAAAAEREARQAREEAERLGAEAAALRGGRRVVAAISRPLQATRRFRRVNR